MSLDRYDTTGIIDQGKLRVRRQPDFERAMRQMPDGEVTVSISRDTRRSTAVNRLYWRWYVQPLAEYTGYTPHAVHSYLKQRFLSVSHIVIANPDGEVVDEADVEPTTTTLTKTEFSAYLDAISEFAESLNVPVGAPTEYAHG
jgi:hypothetical protein